jgi:outer membrane protein TolC
MITLDDAITTATERNVEARSSEAEIVAADATHFGSRGENLPKIKLDGAIQEWNSSFDLPFKIPGASGPPPVLTVRDQFTWTFGATLTQPITGLFSGLDRMKADKLGIDVAKIQRDATKRDVGFRTAEQYLRLLEAKRLVEVARASVVSLEAQRKQAASLHQNGVIAKNDLLRAELALSNAKQRVIQAKGNVVLGRGRLATLVGLKPGDNVDAAPIGVTNDPTATPAVAVDSAEQQATQRRLEVAVFKKKIEQADARVGAAKGRLLPQINAAANYTHFHGSAFQQADAAYVGVVGSWDIWDWGTTYAQTKEAQAHKDEAEIARERIEEQVRLEARQAAVDAQTAREALTVARTALAQAEENYRIVSLRYEQAQSTTFDVVDAESLLTQARAQVETATYDWLVAQLGLQRATGEAKPSVR